MKKEGWSKRDIYKKEEGEREKEGGRDEGR